MPIPTSAQFRIYPSLFVSILSGEFDTVSGSLPVVQAPLATRETIAAYYESEVNNPATSPKVRRVELNSFASHYTPAVGIYETQAFLKRTVIFDSTGTPTPIDFIDSDFPLGCRFNQLQVVLSGPGGASAWQDNRKCLDFKLKARLFPVLETSYPTVPGGTSSASAIVPFSQHWGADQVFGTTIGHYFNVIDDPGGPGQTLYIPINQFYLQGVYNFGWISLTVDPETANPGDTIVITDALSNFELFTDFKVCWKPNPDSEDLVCAMVPRGYWTKTNSQITLKLPLDNGLPFGNRIMRVFGIITSGSWPIPDGSPNNEIELARINSTPILTNGSGIYNLTTGKRNDTYYDRSTSPVSLIDLKIPTPLARTGFF